ncbi:MAG: pseudouridine synthase [Candidatus Zixiibacteriota bacterium]
MRTDAPQESPRERGKERLNRFLARAGIGSRRRADDIIAAGRVTINGVPVDKLATMVDPEHDKIAVDGKPLLPPPTEAIWILMNKAAGVLTTRRDARGRATIFDGLPPVYAQLIPVGRLDLDTEGVILLTNDGDTANRLMHPRYEVDRVYEAAVRGVPERATLKRFRDGIDLGDKTPAVAEAEIVATHGRGAILRLTLHEGRKREVKRLCEAVGHPVLHLRRISYAGLSARGIEIGGWRKLEPAEIARLTRWRANQDAVE